MAAARRAGVEHVVFLSVLGAERNPLLPHYRIERLLRASGMAYTLLRASYFMQNLTSVHREEIRQRGELFVPAGRGRTSFVDARDVATAGAAALTEPGHLNRAYALTGPAAVDFYHVARLLTEVLSRPVFYRAPSTARYAFTLLRRGLPLRAGGGDRGDLHLHPGGPGGDGRRRHGGRAAPPAGHPAALRRGPPAPLGLSAALVPAAQDPAAAGANSCPARAWRGPQGSV